MNQNTGYRLACTPAARIARAIEAREDGQALRDGRSPVALPPTLASLARPRD